MQIVMFYGGRRSLLIASYFTEQNSFRSTEKMDGKEMGLRSEAIKSHLEAS